MWFTAAGTQVGKCVGGVGLGGSEHVNRRCGQHPGIDAHHASPSCSHALLEVSACRGHCPHKFDAGLGAGPIEHLPPAPLTAQLGSPIAQRLVS